MDFGGAPRISAVGAAQLAPRSDSVSPAGSTRAELPAEKTVQSAAAGEALQLDIRARSEDARRQDASRAPSREASAKDDGRGRDAASVLQDMRKTIDRRLVIDQKTNSIVLEKTDRDTGETVEQLPDEAMLKLRALSRELIERAREAAAGSPEHVVERTA